MTWVGSINKGWRNKETDEFIEFQERKNVFHIWLMGTVNGRKRGTKLGSANTESDAREIAINKIKEINEGRWFSRYE